VPAQQKLAHCYLNGIGIRKNEEEGYVLLASLALWGDEEAWTLLQSAAASENPAAERAMWLYYREKNDRETGYHWLEGTRCQKWTKTKGKRILYS
jgi:TPR repeat protein